MLKVFRRRRENRAVVDRLYDALVARARDPFLFLDGGLPDTVMGRYEALSIEVFLFLARCRGEEKLHALTQDLVDRFMRDVDHSIRELGISYLGVPKRMRKLAAQFYARIAAFEEPLLAGDGAMLARALAERTFGGDDRMNTDAPERLARYMIEEYRLLSRASADAILRGELTGGSRDTHHDAQ